jgi:acetylornithine deacetylase/succinyl-diaminopimelate desuccinylase-like protein
VLDEAHPVAQAAIATYETIFELPPVVDKWTFSTNGVGSMGLMKVPTIGFGPGEEEVAHSVMERVSIRHLVKAAQFYAAFPLTFVDTVNQRHG